MTAAPGLMAAPSMPMQSLDFSFMKFHNTSEDSF